MIMANCGIKDLILEYEWNMFLLTFMHDSLGTIGEDLTVMWHKSPYRENNEEHLNQGFWFLMMALMILGAWALHIWMHQLFQIRETIDSSDMGSWMVWVCECLFSFVQIENLEQFLVFKGIYSVLNCYSTLKLPIYIKIYNFLEILKETLFYWNCLWTTWQHQEPKRN